MDDSAARAAVARSDAGVCGLACARERSGRAVALQSLAQRGQDAHHRHPPDQELRRREAAARRACSGAVAAGPGAGDVLRRARLAAPRPGLDEIAVVTADRVAESAAARQRRARCFTTPARPARPRPPTIGIRHALAARLRARAAGARRHAAARPGRGGRACSSAPTPHPVAIVPDRHGTGTNAPAALARRTPSRPASARTASTATSAGARAAGIEPRGRPPGSLMLDVDTPDDLAELPAASRSCRGHAPLTRGALRQLDRVPGRGGAGRRAARLSGHGSPRSPACPRCGRGDDLAALLAAAAPATSAAGDVLVVAHKVVSKAEGRMRALADDRAGRARRGARRGAGQGPAPGPGGARRDACAAAGRARRADLRDPARLRVRERRRRPVEHRATATRWCCCPRTPTPRHARCARRLPGARPAVVVSRLLRPPLAAGPDRRGASAPRAWWRSTTGAGRARTPAARELRGHRDRAWPTPLAGAADLARAKDSRRAGGASCAGWSGRDRRTTGPGAAALRRAAPRGRGPRFADGAVAYACAGDLVRRAATGALVDLVTAPRALGAL